MRHPKILAIVLAGGKGSRLAGLTEAKPKPVLPVGGTYRLVDVALSNLAHSGVSDVGMVQQYLPHALNDYVAGGRPWDLDRSHGGLQVLPPFEGGDGEGFADGNADALYRQRAWIRAAAPDLVLVLSADHLYTMDFRDVVDTHVDADADLTIVTTEIEEDASRYGVVTADEHGRVTAFDYKPDDPTGHLVATEVFCYSAGPLLDALEELQREHGRLDDYGDQLVPWFVEHRTVVEHRHRGYWRDLGTLPAYWTANRELVHGEGARLDDPAWPILSAAPQLLPARVGAGAQVADSLLSPGARVEGIVSGSVVGVGCVVEAGATVRDCVLLGGVRVPSGAELDGCVVDEGAQLPARRFGTAGHVTLIGSDGRVDSRDRLD